MRTIKTSPSSDLGRQLGLVGPGAWVLAGLYAAVYFVVVLVFAGPSTRTPIDTAELASVIFAACLLASPSRTPLPLWRTATVVVIATGVVLAMTWRLPTTRPPGLDAWELGAVNFLLFGLALRARIFAAWLGAALTVMVVLGWSTLETESPLFGLSFTYGQPVTLLAGTIFAMALHRTARRIIELRAAEQERAASEARERANSEVTEQELQAVREIAAVTLREIAEGETSDPIAIRSLEAELRDYIRGRRLFTEPLATALRAARARGVDVTVLDDAGERAILVEALAPAVHWATELVKTNCRSSLTLRLTSTSNGIALTFSADGTETARLPIDDSESDRPTS